MRRWDSDTQINPEILILMWNFLIFKKECDEIKEKHSSTTLQELFCRENLILGVRGGRKIRMYNAGQG